MRPKVLLTGASGRIGKRVLNKLLIRGYAVKVLIHHHTPEVPTGCDVECVRGDILSEKQMLEAAMGCQIICHLAATFDMFPPAVFEKTNDSLFENIIHGTYNLLEASRSVNDLMLFLFASTDAVYATGPIKYESPITEETELHPMPGRFYAVAKAAGENLSIN